VPLATDNAIIPAATTTNLTAESNALSVTIGAGSTLALGAQTLNVYGDWANGGTLNGGTGKVALRGGAAQSIGAESNFYDFQINKSAETATLTGSVTTTRDFTLTAGTFAPGANKVSIGRNYSNGGGTLTEAGSTFEFDGSGAQTVNAETFNNVIVRKSAETLSLTGTVTISGTLVTTGGAGTLSAVDQLLTVTGVSTIGSGTAVTSTTGTITFTGAVTNAGGIGSDSGNALFSSTLTNTGTLDIGAGYATTTGP
jgi:hypothetical protein